VRSLIPFCFKEPTEFAFSIDYRWKLPYHHCFVRALLEKESPQLANFATTTGGPAAPMRPTNLNKFWPLFKPLAGKVTRKLVRIPIRTHSNECEEEDASSLAIRRGWLDYAATLGLLEPSKMHSGALYNSDELRTVVAQAWRKNFKYEEFLGRIITVEMALRAVGASMAQ